MGLSEEQERAIESYNASAAPAREEQERAIESYNASRRAREEQERAIESYNASRREREVGSTQAATPTSLTADRERPRSHRSLYYTILSALLGFNIFQSLFGRESSGGDECGSWFFPVLDEPGNPIGFFTSGADRACPRFISGTLTEALMSALALAAVAATIYLTSDSH